ncbi:fibronectin type III domain-containing protein [Flagellimonas sp.]|uniref:fibronectin type III domain-containing protein n=1 Tax=Flagellimonas sp. TaxID=2058762 RepID=UPI003AB5D7D5
MASNLKKSVFVFVHVLIASYGLGQELMMDSLKTPTLVLKSRVKDDKVHLRWGPTDKIGWKHGLEYGYIIERITILREDGPLSKSEKEVLTGGAIKPKPLSEWETLVQVNDMAAVAAQAMYGDTFNTNSEGDGLLMQVINESSELDQRFAFSMFAVDQDFEVAQYAGLGCVDASIKKDERYIYKVRLAAPPELYQVQEAGILIDPSQTEVLPKPYDFAAYYYNNAFVLIWEYDSLLEFYTSYDLERSEDGFTFNKVNQVPITKLAVTEVSGISFTDSIPEYGKKYWYRVRGKTLFNETGPASDTTSVIAFRELLTGPEMGKSEIISEQRAIIHWDFPKDEQWKLHHFDVLRADRAIGPYKEVAKQLGKEARSYEYDGLASINYFKVRAYGVADDHQDSSPTMIQPIDSIPPRKPTGLKGTIDTLGVVQLNWSPNEEMDLHGYTILRADGPNQEFTRRTKRELVETEFTDTINIKTFQKNVYYRIIASDLRYNESIPSDTLVLERPSRIPPTSPVFNAYELIGDSVLLKWTPSSSDRLAKQVIYRRDPSMKEGVWQNIFETDDLSKTLYKDRDTQPNTVYTYTITSVNSLGLESAPAPTITITTPPRLLQPKVKAFMATVDREVKSITLNWRYDQPGVLELQLYKKESGGNYALYRTLNLSVNQFLDTKLVPNSHYGYGLRAVFSDGGLSEWSEIDVKY